MSNPSSKHAATGTNDRKCIVTGVCQAKDRMVRFVVSPDGQIVADIAADLPGRGMWVSATREAVRKAVEDKRFARAARQQVSVADDLDMHVETMLVRRCVQLLGLARKSGVAVAGRMKVDSQLRQGTTGVLISALEAADDGKHKLERVARAAAPRAQFVNCLQGTELGLAFAAENVIHAALAQGRLADRFCREAERLSGFRAGVRAEFGEPEA